MVIVRPTRWRRVFDCSRAETIGRQILDPDDHAPVWAVPPQGAVHTIRGRFDDFGWIAMALAAHSGGYADHLLQR